MAWSLARRSFLYEQGAPSTLTHRARDVPETLQETCPCLRCNVASSICSCLIRILGLCWRRDVCCSFVTSDLRIASIVAKRRESIEDMARLGRFPPRKGHLFSNKQKPGLTTSEVWFSKFQRKSRMSNSKDHYNQSLMLVPRFPHPLDVETVRRCAWRLAERHDMLRASSWATFSALGPAGTSWPSFSWDSADF